MSLVSEAQGIYENFDSYPASLKILAGLAVASVPLSLVAATYSFIEVFKKPSDRQ